MTPCASHGRLITMSMLLLLTVLLVGCRPAAAQPPPAQSTVYYGYYASWTGMKPDQIDFTLFTHLSHAFLTADTSGALTGPPPDQIAAFVRLAHQHHVKALIALGGADSGTSLNAIAGDPAKLTRLAADVTAFARANGYDGVDVDWEIPENRKVQFTAFVDTLRADLNAWRPDALLTMAVGATDWDGQWIDGTAIRDSIDFMQIMSYDLHGAWTSSHAGFNSPLFETDSDPVDGHAFSFQKFVDYWTGKGIPKSKLVVGVPLYGYGFAVAKWGDKPADRFGYREIKYSDVAGLIQQGYVAQRDVQAQAPYLQSSDPSKPELITYDDEQSVRAKGAWAKQQGLRGLMFWEISQDLVAPKQGGKPVNTLVRAAEAGYKAGK